MKIHESTTFKNEYFNTVKRDLNSRYKGRIGRFVLSRRKKALKTKSLVKFLNQKLDRKKIIGVAVNPMKETLDYSKVLNKETKLIVLTRENHIKQWISVKNVHAERDEGHEKPFHAYSNDRANANRKFRIEEDDIVNILDLKEKHQRFLNMMDNLESPKLRLTYEEDINADPRQLMEKVADFLELGFSRRWEEELTTGKSGYHKLVNDDLREVIENYDELTAHEDLKVYL